MSVDTIQAVRREQAELHTEVHSPDHAGMYIITLDLRCRWRLARLRQHAEEEIAVIRRVPHPLSPLLPALFFPPE